MAVRPEHEWLRESWRRHRELTEPLSLDEDQRRLLEVRWLEEAKHYDDVWRRRRLTYVLLGCVTIVAGLAIPVLAALDTPRWSLALAGSLAALGGALEGFLGLGHRWRQQRRTADLIKAEGLRFIELRTPYNGFETHQAAFPQFIDRLERINETQSEAYLALTSQEPTDAAQRVEALRERTGSQ
jgi:hypothetical protein